MRLLSRAHDRFKILFCGRDEFSCLVLNELHRATEVWNELGIVTNPDQLLGRHKKTYSMSPLKTLARSLDVPVHEIPHIKSEFRHWKLPNPFHGVETPPPEHLLITASFGRIIPNSFLASFQPERRLNVHPSLLPAYRGAAPIQRAMMDGVTTTGVSIIQMLERSKGIDAGSIFAQTQMPVPKDVPFPVLRDELAREGGQLLVQVLRDMIEGKSKALEQSDATHSPRAKAIKVEDSFISFSTMTAQTIMHRHLAISHQRPLTTATTNGKTLQLHLLSEFSEFPPHFSLPDVPGSASYFPPTRALLVRCADGTVISAGQLKQEGKAILSPKDWWNGARSLNLVQDNIVYFVDVPQL